MSLAGSIFHFNHSTICSCCCVLLISEL